MSNETPTTTGPGRPRDHLLDQRIIKAATAVLRERGWLRTTMEEIAARADVSKATLYRRYPSKAAVAFDAWVGDRKQRFPGTDTGSVWGDLLAYVLGSVQMAKTGGWVRILPGLLAEMPTDPSVNEAIERVWSWRRGVVGEIVDRANARGEIRSDVESDHVNELLDGPLLLRLLVTGDPLDVPFADKLVDDVMAVIGRGH